MAELQQAFDAGLHVVVKRDCPTCELIEPVLRQLAEAGAHVYCQDDAGFPAAVEVIDDRELARSWQLDVEIVPTLFVVGADGSRSRAEGWQRDEWRALSGLSELGAGLPLMRPGCGSRTREPGAEERLALRFGGAGLAARQVAVDADDDEVEAVYDRGWSDGLPVVPPTPLRVLRMLRGTTRAPDEVIGAVPPDLVPCTVEKIAINAVMAGCRPEYLPVVIAAVEAALDDAFCMHGLLATTYFSGPMVVVNGPVARRIGMNSGGNALGQGNRANATIGRALQLVVRNVGGGRPGGVDRSTLGNPGKYSFCFAEDEAGSCWESLAVERGFQPQQSVVTLFAADGVQGIVDQKSRAPESLARSFAAGLRVVSHPKMVLAADAFLVVSPEHERVFREAGWSKARLKEALGELLTIDGSELVRGAGGIDEGLPDSVLGKRLPKFRAGGLQVVRAGGAAGLFSAIIGGWGASGSIGSSPVSREVTGIAG